MSTTTKQTTVALWHYQCPECGLGDGDTGNHAQTHAIYCEILRRPAGAIQALAPVDVPQARFRLWLWPSLMPL